MYLTQIKRLICLTPWLAWNQYMKGFAQTISGKDDQPNNMLNKPRAPRTWHISRRVWTPLVDGGGIENFS
jgi:hypothetical protein